MFQQGYPLKAFLYERLATQLEVPFFFNSNIFQYEDFIKRYPNTPESYRLTKIYTKHFPVSNGQLVPELELADSTGRKILIAAGFDRNSMSKAFSKINKMASYNETPEILSTHPPMEKRIKNIQNKKIKIKIIRRRE